MKGKEKSWIWRERAGIVCLILTIISLSITLTINFRLLYTIDIDVLNILDYVSMDKTTLLKNYGELMSYLNNPLNHTLQLPDFPVSKSGAFHFYEVKRLFLLCYGVLILTIIPSGIFIWRLMRNKRVWRLIRPFQWGMIIPVIFGAVMAIGFDQFFVAFHGVFFNNDDWMFDPMTDPIINVLPEEFFMHCFILFFVLLELFFFIGIIFGKRELKKM
ncbi:TIGR01906 family membrane protein [Enterococcus caccae]|uniref:Integral membrane protein n=1 Tax=Enterococcus caccae ATCC BAA-1240 TaxID=1158612 RepID=R3WEQ8_9ENTE|nr:TIGR01906 family membrane protein [Enterococcus caccae]EOL45922.1 integral membrane protein [Enterococcus caccae ATCC BAA-1240]EOT61118.1 integral membrane protein [Enterococcus caccae ATCC BAA-1240]OJG27851.1 integral membrane protein [Enterococcus caccae]